MLVALAASFIASIVGVWLSDSSEPPEDKPYGLWCGIAVYVVGILVAVLDVLVFRRRHKPALPIPMAEKESVPKQGMITTRNGIRLFVHIATIAIFGVLAWGSDYRTHAEPEVLSLAKSAAFFVLALPPAIETMTLVELGGLRSNVGLHAALCPAVFVIHHALWLWPIVWKPFRSGWSNTVIPVAAYVILPIIEITFCRSFIGNIN
jgi:hypothetical protein